MSKELKYSWIIVLSFLLASCSSNNLDIISNLTVVNESNSDFNGVFEVNIADIPNFDEVNNAIAFKGEIPIATQWCDKNGDGTIDVLCVKLDAKAKSHTNISIAKSENTSKYNNFKPETQAELWHKTTGKFKNGKYVGGGNFSKFDSLRVPNGFSDHAYFIKYEGPGWESDKVGYRLYLDWRNAIDVFGKQVSEPILEGVGMDGYESYHHLQDWGMDVLKVGKSLGIGSTGFWDGEKAVRVEKTDSVICRILSSGILRSQVQIWYNGWDFNNSKVDLVSVKSIDAGSRMTHEHLVFNKPVKDICTGIRKEPNTQLINLLSPDKTWGCIATWGKQSLNDDMLGLGIIYSMNQKPILTEDENSHVVVFEEEGKEFNYYFLAAWEREKDGVKTKEEFIKYLKEQLHRMENPLLVVEN